MPSCVRLKKNLKYRISYRDRFFFADCNITRVLARSCDLLSQKIVFVQAKLVEASSKMRCLFPLLVLFALYISPPAQAAGAGVNYREDEDFLRWCAEFYDSEDDNDLARIYPTWRENADYVQRQNSLGLSYTLSLNKFAHLVSQFRCVL